MVTHREEDANTHKQWIGQATVGHGKPHERGVVGLQLGSGSLAWPIQGVVGVGAAPLQQRRVSEGKKAHDPQWWSTASRPPAPPPNRS